MEVLVTGGAGYIGSHTVLLLIESGFKVVVVDNLSNGHLESIKRIEKLTGSRVIFYECDLQNRLMIEKVFANHNINAVMHFAGFKSVSESTVEPLSYYSNNIAGTLNLLEAMKKFKVYRMVYSSSATIYGLKAKPPYSEDYPLGDPVSPYGTSKAMTEKILEDLSKSAREWNIVTLRYFNPIGAHPSGVIGEDPKGVPNNLLPYISKVAAGKLDRLEVFGNDYPTSDGTCKRDYIHVCDLAEGHLCALRKIENGYNVFNLGTGNSTSVLEIIKLFEEECGFKIPYIISKRRAGDLSDYYAKVDKARKVLGWEARKNIKHMIADVWNWQKNNPNGYKIK